MILIHRVLVVALFFHRAFGFSPPCLGIGSILFPVRGTSIEPVSEDEFIRETIQDTSDFFVDAFWTSKVGGGASTLSTRQQQSLKQSQMAEFTKRYGGRNFRRQAELLVCRNSDDEIVACAGVEVDDIPEGHLRSRDYLTEAPIMSNLAVDQRYRRRGVAEQVVKAVERYVQDEWDYKECFLYVEQRNIGAVKLYRKLGYRKVWLDTNANTLLPMEDGSLITASTEILCMRKKFGRSFFGL